MKPPFGKLSVVVLGLLVAGILETAACSSSEKPFTPTWKAEDLTTVDAAADLQDFANANLGGQFASFPNLNFMEDPIRETLADTHCDYTPVTAGTPSEFRCVMSPRANVHPGCLLVWSLVPQFEANDPTMLATVDKRIHVVEKFSASGYGLNKTRGKSPAEFIGVSSVLCDAKKQPTDVVDAPLRVTFVLNRAELLLKYGALFRTIGFDWLSEMHLDRPYVAEIFALASLYRITQAIYKDKDAFPELVSIRHDKLFDSARLDAFRSLDSDNIWVMNNSDGQLGNSRGSCLLAADAAGLPSTLKRHAAPSAFISSAYIADRSIVLTTASGDSFSLPCVLLSALVTRDMSAIKNYPSQLEGKMVQYFLLPTEDPEKDTPAAVRRGYYLRAAAFTLYTLGFRVEYSDSEEYKAKQVTGLWPRPEFLQPAPAQPGTH